MMNDDFELWIDQQRILCTFATIYQWSRSKIVATGLSFRNISLIVTSCACIEEKEGRTQNAGVTLQKQQVLGCRRQ
jgi:hypothetical protein